MTTPIAILGPTGSGKSSLASALAERLGGTVVNGDPFQAYRDLPIGTGQPTEAERRGVPHLGYGVHGLETSLNPAGFGAEVRAWLAAAPRPLLVTGSGLYLRGIWGQLSDLPELPEALVQRTRHWAQVLGPEALHRYLGAVDPRRAADLHPRDGSRIQRALALHLGTGRRPSDLLDRVVRAVPEGWRALLVLPSRDRLRERIAARVAAMLAQGWAGEAAALRSRGMEPALRRLRPLGYEALLDDPRGARARIIRDTQTYGKRQATWFSNQLPGLPTWDPDRETLAEAIGKLGE